MAATILIVEDEHAVARGIQYALQQEGYEVAVARSGEEGLDIATRQAPDLVVLDVRLPGMDGFEVLRRLRAAGAKMPVLVLTARDDEVDKVIGLELGADDYLTKPFGRQELLARIAAVMRRVDAAGGPVGSGSTLQAGALTIEPGRHEAHVNDALLPLTATEYRLLEALVRAGGDVVPHARLVRAGWPSEPNPDLLWLKPHLARLRAKVASAGGPAVVAVRSVGYRVEAG